MIIYVLVSYKTNQKVAIRKKQSGKAINMPNKVLWNKWIYVTKKKDSLHLPGTTRIQGEYVPKNIPTYVSNIY